MVVFPHVNASGGALLNGAPMVEPPIPWKKSALTPNLSSWDQTDDMRPRGLLRHPAALALGIAGHLCHGGQRAGQLERAAVAAAEDAVPPPVDRPTRLVPPARER